MDTTNSLVEIQKRYSGCNLLMPVASEVQINPYYKYTVMEVQADLSENSGDIFKVGSIQTGYDTQAKKATYANVYSPAKPLLMKLAAAAGIQFDPTNTYGTYLSKNCYKAKAYGAMRMPDGTGKTQVDEKVINLEDEEDKFRLEFMDKSIEGITDWRAAQAAAKLFKGEWVVTDEKNEKGYPIKKYVIADEDRQKYVERSVLVNMTLLRKTFAEKAMTGAILRVIRALIGLKGTYTIEELEKPFAIPRVTFSPDYSNPEVRSAMLQQGMSSVSNMFGSGASPILPPTQVPHDESQFDPAEFEDNPAFSSDTPEDEGELAPVADETALPEDGNLNTCAECSADINDSVSQFSQKTFGRPLCVICQKQEKGDH